VEAPACEGGVSCLQAALLGERFTPKPVLEAILARYEGSDHAVPLDCTGYKLVKGLDERTAELALHQIQSDRARLKAEHKEAVEALGGSTLWGWARASIWMLRRCCASAREGLKVVCGVYDDLAEIAGLSWKRPSRGVPRRRIPRMARRRRPAAHVAWLGGDAEMGGGGHDGDAGGNGGGGGINDVGGVGGIGAGANDVGRGGVDVGGQGWWGEAGDGAAGANAAAAGDAEAARVFAGVGDALDGAMMAEIMAAGGGGCFGRGNGWNSGSDFSENFGRCWRV